MNNNNYNNNDGNNTWQSLRALTTLYSLITGKSFLCRRTLWKNTKFDEGSVRFTPAKRKDIHRSCSMNICVYHFISSTSGGFLVKFTLSKS